MRYRRCWWGAASGALLWALIAAGCSNKSTGSDGGAGTDGGAPVAGTGGSSGGGGGATGGAPGAGGAGGTTTAGSDAGSSSDGPRPNDAGGTPGGPMGTQPLGSLCANSGNCSQTSGMAVCCVNTCTLAEACPSNPNYLPCVKASDCAQFGGGKVCCVAGGMSYCTKPSACAGMILR